MWDILKQQSRPKCFTYVEKNTQLKQIKTTKTAKYENSFKIHFKNRCDLRLVLKVSTEGENLIKQGKAFQIRLRRRQLSVLSLVHAVYC